MLNAVIQGFGDKAQWIHALLPVELRQLPKDCKTYEEFAPLFLLEATTTEQINPLTKNLSQAVSEDICKGLEQLWEADQAVLSGFDQFIPTIEELAPKWAEKLLDDGRIVLNGSGSSGRLSLGLAARCQEVSKRFGKQIIGVMAGGDSAMIRAKEGYEDSEAEGEKCLQFLGMTKKDISIQVSASGSAFFNRGCANQAANQGSQVYYFYNSKDIPQRTEQLFKRGNNPVNRLLLDIGPQSIAGSTRLQSASIAELALGCLLITALLYAEGKVEEARAYPKALAAKMAEANQRIKEQLTNIATFAKKEADLFLSQEANFYRQKDESAKGYVTVLGEKGTLRLGMTDMTEINPTFQINPIRRKSEEGKKRGEYRAYLAGEEDNRAAWDTLVGRSVAEQDRADTDEFLVASGAQGNFSYESRPKGKGNLVIGLSSTGTGAVVDMLKEVKEGDKGLIVVSKDKVQLPEDPKMLTLKLDELPSDDYGQVEALTWKQVLNMISNTAMVLVGKVRGNWMTDMRAANQKLVGRAMRNVMGIWEEETKREMPITEEELYYYVLRVEELKKKFDTQNIYTPSVVRIILAMLFLEKKPVPQDFVEVLAFLAERQEQLSFLTPSSLQSVIQKV